MVNVATLCTALGARKETITAISTFSRDSASLHRLGARTSSGARKVVRSPKPHFMDMRCATAVRGEDMANFGLGADPTALGHLHESFVLCELEKSLLFSTNAGNCITAAMPPARSTSWRKRQGRFWIIRNEGDPNGLACVHHAGQTPRLDAWAAQIVEPN
jgi:hypothetical protein